MAIQVNEITNSAGNGSVDAVNGISIAGTAYNASFAQTMTSVSTEAELNAALIDSSWINIISSFNITGQKSIPSGTTVQCDSVNAVITGVGITATEAMFSLAAGVTNVRFINLNMATAQTDIDCVAIQNTATQNEIVSCNLQIPVATTQSVVYVDGQRNRIYNNELNCNGSISTPGCVLLDVNATNNSIIANVIE